MGTARATLAAVPTLLGVTQVIYRKNTQFERKTWVELLVEKEADLRERVRYFDLALYYACISIWVGPSQLPPPRYAPGPIALAANSRLPLDTPVAMRLIDFKRERAEPPLEDDEAWCQLVALFRTELADLYRNYTANILAAQVGLFLLESFQLLSSFVAGLRAMVGRLSYLNFAQRIFKRKCRNGRRSRRLLLHHAYESCSLLLGTFPDPARVLCGASTQGQPGML